MRRSVLLCALILVTASAGCAATAAAGSTGSTGDQLAAFVGDLLRQVLAAYLT